MKLFYATIFLTIFTTYSFSQNFSTKKGGNCYTLDLPSYMVRTFDLNDVASLQYKNTPKEAYTIVIEDDKEELTSLAMIFQNPNEFLENFIKDYRTSENRTFSEIVEFESNGYPHAQVEMTWNDEDGDFYMLATSVETKGHFYNILCWTLLENKDLLKKDYLTISKSLKE